MMERLFVENPPSGGVGIYEYSCSNPKCDYTGKIEFDCNPEYDRDEMVDVLIFRCPRCHSKMKREKEVKV